MSICKTIFNKDLYQLTLSDLTEFFTTPQEENTFLEFKSGHVTLEIVHKEVVAFLNTEGGLLILGAPQEQDRIAQGNLMPCRFITNQDTLMRSIGSRISPSPTHVKAASFDYLSGKVFVLEIPQSLNPPHQVNDDGKYYIRLEREAKAAPHGIIEALFNKRRYSNLAAEIGILDTMNPYQPSAYIKLKNDSDTHAESTGYLMEIAGVRKLRRSNTNFAYKNLKDDLLTIRNNGPEFLVKGLELTIQLDFELRTKYLHIFFSYYCKDSRLKYIEILYDSVLKKHLRRFYSDSDEKNIGDVEDGLVEFVKLRRTKLAALFGISGPWNDNEEFIFKVYDIGSDLGIRMPESLVDLYVVSDGYIGDVGNSQLLISTVEQLSESIRTRSPKLLTRIEIGVYGDYLVFYDYSEEDNHVFRWWKTDPMTFEDKEREGSSFYDFIEDIFEEFQESG